MTRSILTGALVRPISGVNADNFSARWTKDGVNFPTAGKWTFRVSADDGVRMWIDVTPIVDEWHGYSGVPYEVSIDTLTAGNSQSQGRILRGNQWREYQSGMVLCRWHSPARQRRRGQLGRQLLQ